MVASLCWCNSVRKKNNGSNVVGDNTWTAELHSVNVNLGKTCSKVLL
jgi:hypothetical protein